MHTPISKTQIVRTLLQHRKIANERNPLSSQGKYAKCIGYIVVAIVVLYLMALSILMSLAVNGDRTMTAIEFLFFILPCGLIFDFVMRFVIQQTPAQSVRPYILLPFPRKLCIDTFIFSALSSKGNLIWFAFFLPYCIMSVVFSYGIATTIYSLFYILILILINNQCYLIVRTLVNDKLIWWLLPAAILAILFTPLYVGNDAGFDQLFQVFAAPGNAIAHHNPLPLLIAIATLAICVVVNRELQFKYIYAELANTEKKTGIKSFAKFSFLERYGEIGTFLQLEAKLLFRNKTPRGNFRNCIFVICMLSAAIVFTDIYDSKIMTNFWAFYNYMIFGATILIGVMGFEGNYIDCLLVHKENILTLLKAKYIFYSALLLLPFLLMLPMVFAGKWSIYMLISFAIYTMGVQYFAIFQLAVYNTRTIPLNEKINGKAGFDGNYGPLITMGIVLLVPNVVFGTLQALFSKNIAYTIITIIGLAFILTHNIWLRNIYNRLMKRKYQNLEGFSSSR